MAIVLGPKLQLLESADEGQNYVDAFRQFLCGFDNLVQASVISSTLTSPPSGPINGDSYIIASPATGLWTGRENQIASWSTSPATGPTWQFFIPKTGWIVYDEGPPSFVPGFRQFLSSTWSDANVIPQNINFPAGIAIAGHQLTSLSGTGTEIVTAGASTTFGDGHIVTGNGVSNLEDSGIAITNVAQLTTANAFTQAQTFEEGFTSNNLSLIAAATPATNTANQNAPGFVLQSNYWDGSASQPDEWILLSSLGTGANPTTTLQLSHAGSTGAALISVLDDVTIGGVLKNTDFVWLATNQTATNLANQNAPELQFTGSYWNGSAAAHDNWTIEQILGSSTNPTSTLQIIHNGSSGVATVALPNLELTNAVTSGSASAGVITPPAAVYGYLAVNINGTDVRIPYFAP